MAIEDVNDAGGIPGIAVRLDERNQRDAGSTTAQVRRSADALLSDGGVDVVIGAPSSQTTLSVIDNIVCHGVVLFSPGDTAPVLSTYPDRGLYFRTAPSDVLQGRTLGRLVVADGNHTVVVIARDDAYGNSLRQETERAIRDSGGQVLDSFSYDPDASEYGDEVERVRAADPAAIVLIGFHESAPILATMIERGIGPQSKRVYGAEANLDNTLAPEVDPRDPGRLEGMRGTTLRPHPNDPFVTRLREFDPTLRDLVFASHAYDVVVITALATAVAHSDAPAAVAAQINGVTEHGERCTTYADCSRLVQAGRDIDYDGVSGPLEFADAGEPSVGVYAIGELQADGSLKILGSEQAFLEPGGA